MEYTKVREQLHIHKLNEEDNGLAYLTHYWQNSDSKSGSYFKKEASEFLVLNDPEFNYELPFDWDVPFPPTLNPTFTFIDLFAGIGGFRIAFQKQKGKCVFSSEWNKYAQKTYEANFGEIPFGDIDKIRVEKVPEHDILLGGFPCQPFSIAGVSKKNAIGKQHGFLDKTQGTLFFNIARILEEKRPKAFLLENVKNLKSHNKKDTYKVIKETLESLNYIVFDEIIDAKHYVPQHRERIFIAGFNREYFKDDIKFIFPTPPDNEQHLSTILDPNPESKYTLTPNLWKYLQDYASKHKAKGNGFGFGMTNIDGITRTLSARYYKDGSEILIPQGNEKAPRRLTPEECKLLMGYPPEFIINNIGLSDMQLYKQFGNSIVVPVITHVAETLVEFIRKNSFKKKRKINLQKEKMLMEHESKKVRAIAE